MLSTGTINLATVRSTPARKMNGGTCAIQLSSSDLTGNTTFALMVSLDNVLFDGAQNNGTDITGTLTTGGAVVLQLEMVAGIWNRIDFAGSTSGTVTWKILD